MADKWQYRKTWDDRLTQAISFQSRGHIENAIELYKQCIAEGIDDSGTYLTLEELYEKSGKVDDAIRVLHRGKRYSPMKCQPRGRTG